MQRDWLACLVVFLAALAPVAAAQCPANLPARSAPLDAALVAPPDAWWTHDVRGAPVDARSTQFIGALGTRTLRAGFGGDRGIPYAVVDAAQANVSVAVPARGNLRVPLPAQAIREARWIEGSLPGNDARATGPRRL